MDKYPESITQKISNTGARNKTINFGVGLTVAKIIKNAEQINIQNYLHLNEHSHILEELCDKGVIGGFMMTEAIILLKRKYKMPVISTYGKKDNNTGD